MMPESRDCKATDFEELLTRYDNCTNPELKTILREDIIFIGIISLGAMSMHITYKFIDLIGDTLPENLKKRVQRDMNIDHAGNRKTGRCSELAYPAGSAICIKKRADRS